MTPAPNGLSQTATTTPQTIYTRDLSKGGPGSAFPYDSASSQVEIENEGDTQNLKVLVPEAHGDSPAIVKPGQTKVFTVPGGISRIDVWTASGTTDFSWNTLAAVRA
jgi:hypothetical protein